MNLASALNNASTVLTLEGIMESFKVSKKDAELLLNCITCASVDSGFYLPLTQTINENGEEAYSLLSDEVDIKGRPHRLNRKESLSILLALSVCGLTEQSSLYKKLEGILVNDKEELEQFGQMIYEDQDAHTSLNLQRCAVTCLTHKRISCTYFSETSTSPKTHILDPLNYFYSNQNWYINAFDMDVSDCRVFRVDRLSDIKVCGKADPHTDFIPKKEMFDTSERVDMQLNNYEEYTNVFEWPSMRIHKIEGTTLYADIAYTGSLWLPKRVVACAGDLIVDNDHIMKEARAYAQKLIDA